MESGNSGEGCKVCSVRECNSSNPQGNASVLSYNARALGGGWYWVTIKLHGLTLTGMIRDVEREWQTRIPTV